MVLDLVALAILVVFVLMGALRGGVASATSLATLLLSYVAAVWAAQNLGASVSEKLGIAPYLGAPVAGTAAFLAAAVIGGVLGLGLKHWARRLRGDSSMGVLNRWLGGLFGALRGGLIICLLAWLAIWLDAARETGSFAWLDAAPPIESSSVAMVTEHVVEAAVVAAMDGDGRAEQVVARFAARPGTAVRSAQALLADPRIEALQQDRFFWTLVENGAYARAMNTRSFEAIANSEAMRAMFADVGVIGSEAVLDAQVFRREVGEVLAELGPRLRGLANDPDLERLAADPEVVSLLEAGDTLGLIQHEGIRQLVAKVSKAP